MKQVFLFLFILFLSPELLYCGNITKKELLADSLYVKGIKEYEKKSYKKALYYFSQVTKINETIDRIEPYYSSNSTHWEASSLFHLGDTVSAYNISDEYMLEPVDQRQTVISDSLWALADIAYEEENFDLSILMAKEAISYEISILGDHHYYVANSYASLSDILLEEGDIEQATELLFNLNISY